MDQCPSHGDDDADSSSESPPASRGSGGESGSVPGGESGSVSGHEAGSAPGSDSGSVPGRGLSRRAFGKAAVAIGGTTALSACLDWSDDEPVPEGVDDPSTLPDRQHAWNEFVGRDRNGNVATPRHHVLLLLDLAAEGTPTDEDRETVETALRSLERAYEWSNDGLVFTLGYSPAYFERYDAPLPESVDLPTPEAMAAFEDPALDTPDALLHLASDRPEVVLEAESALFGEVAAANGREMAATLEGVFERPDPQDTTRRRTGFVGTGLPAENTDVDGVPDDADVDEDSPLYMNFVSGFEKNQAREASVTIDEGPFAGGTTQHVSKIRLNLDQWYDQDSRYQRVAKMFCPVHAEAGRVEGPGHNLGTDSGVDGECVEDVDEHAREHGMVGHSQKMAADARRDDEPLLIRRDFDSTDDGHAGLHFVAVQRSIADFVETREAMNGAAHAESSGVGQRVNNGILQYMRVLRRGNYLLPPRALRALPPVAP